MFFFFRRRKSKKKSFFRTILPFLGTRDYNDHHVEYHYEYHENEEGFLQRWLDTFLHKIGYLQFDDIHDQTDEEHDDIEEEDEEAQEEFVEHPGSYVEIPSDSFIDSQHQYEAFENSSSFEATEGKK